MRITFVLPPVNMRGGTKVVAIYAEQLQHRGHIVRVVSPPPPSVALRRKLKAWLLRRDIDNDSRSPPSFFDGIKVDHTILDRYRPVTDTDVPDADVVVATWWETAEWVYALSPAKGAKAYLIQHHEVFPHLPIERCQATYRLPLHKIVIARWLKKVMADEYGDPSADLVPNSVDHAQFFADSRNKQSVPTAGLLYASTPFKGLDIALAALEDVRKNFPDLRVISFGTEKIKPHLSLPSNAEFIFHPAQELIRTLYSRCDVWVTASRSEGFNLPAMEAMACRTPVVSTKTGWPAEAIVTGKNGVLVDVGDYQGLRDGISWSLSQTNERWRELSANAYETVAKSSWEASTVLLERALENARAKRKEMPCLTI